MSYDIAIKYTFFSYSSWSFYFAATEKGLCFVGSLNGDLNELITWADKKINRHTLQYDPDGLSAYAFEFIEYFNGKRMTFSFPLNLIGTTFQRQVWQQLLLIPYGQSSTYSQIGTLLGKPGASRAVGSAVGQNPILIVVPCHRVHKKDGSHSGFRGGIQMKHALLDIEHSFIRNNGNKNKR